MHGLRPVNGVQYEPLGWLRGGDTNHPKDKQQNAAQDCERPMIKPYKSKSNTYAPSKHKSNIEKLREALGEGRK